MQHKTAWFVRAGAWRLGAAGALLAALCGCGIPFLRHQIALRELTLNVAPRANGNSAFAVELVAVDDDALLAKLQALSAAQWFDPQANWKRDYPQTLRSWYYEITPGQQLQLKPTAFGGQRARALLLFANYKGQGAYRLRLDDYPRAAVRFAEHDIELEPLP